MNDAIDVTNGTSKEERMWAMLCHLGGLTIYLGIPFANFIVPLVIWMIYRDKYPLVRDQGKEVLNFQITLLLVAAAIVALCFLLIGFFLLPILIVLPVYQLIVTIIGAIKSYDGTAYRYPLTLRLL
jgi:uncharacterized Tic20 family protein